MTTNIVTAHPAKQDNAAEVSALALFQAGRLDEAVALVGHAVQEAPGDIGQRLLLAELFLFTGEFERGDKALAPMELLEASVAPGVALFRQLLRAEVLRQQTWEDGRMPEFIDGPTPALTLYLKSLLMLREADAEAAAEVAQEAETARPTCSGQHNGAAFDDLRDADDLAAGFLEVLTVTGRYFWVPFERIDEAHFHPAQRLRDLYWRRCSLSTKGGPEGDVYIPALYPAPVGGAKNLLAVGRTTEWLGEMVVRGAGQRVLLIGDEGVAIQEVGTLVFG